MYHCYVFQCFLDEEGCGHNFEVFVEQKHISKLRPQCPKCKKLHSVHRDFSAEMVGGNTGPRTLGTLAEKNAQNWSNDYKAELTKKHNAYKYRIPDKKLPPGMKYGKQILKEQGEYNET